MCLKFLGTVAVNELDAGPINILCIPSTFNSDSDFGDNTFGGLYLTARITTTIAMASSFMAGASLPCSFCQTVREVSVMIPGLTTCPGGYDMEYRGTMMSRGGTSDSRSEAICVSVSGAVSFGAAVMSAQTEVGPLNIACLGDALCPDLQDRFDIPCVVCTTTQA